MIIAGTFSSCAKKEDELPSIFKDISFGNKNADIFFNKEKIKDLGIKGKIAAAAKVAGSSHIVIFDIERQTIERLKVEKDWEKSPQFSSDGKSLYYSAGRGELAGIFRFDFDTQKETTIVAGKEARLDPVLINDQEIVYVVFPEGKDFYLAKYNMKTGKEEKLEIMLGDKNLAERAAEAVYSEKDNLLYFINDFDESKGAGAINIWSFNLKTGEVKKVTDYSEVKTYKYDNTVIKSPQIYDLNLSKEGNIIYCLRHLEQDEASGQINIVKAEVHVRDLKNGKDKLAAIEGLQVREPFMISKDLIAFCIPDYKEIVLVDIKKPHDKLIFVSLTDFLGDLDYTDR